jgi:hypothetical protein
VPRVVLACGRAGDDGDVVAAQPVRPALRLLPGKVVNMSASCCPCITWRFVLPHASVVMLVSCIWAHISVGARLVMRGEDFLWPRLVVRGGDLSCEAETRHARWRVVMGVPLMRNWTEMQPTGQTLDVLPAPCPESLP